MIEMLYFERLTLVEWRRLDGALLRRLIMPPGGVAEIVMPETLYGWVRGDYDVYTQEPGGDWALRYEVREIEGVQAAEVAEP